MDRIDIERARDEARSLDEQDFAARYPGYYLVVAETADDLPTPFRTLVSEPGEVARRSRDRFLISPVVKTAANPFSDRISVGRARNCDIILRHPSVSKLHAHIRVAQNVEIADVGSINGTRINGRRLDPNRPVRVSMNDTIQFGMLQAVLVDGAGLYQLLQ